MTRMEIANTLRSAAELLREEARWRDGRDEISIQTAERCDRIALAITDATWDFSVGQDYIRIERVKGEEVLGLVAEIPLSLGAEDIALAICNAHNGGLSP